MNVDTAAALDVVRTNIISTINVDTAAALDAVRTKLARGEDLKVEDLHSLKAFHHHQQHEQPAVPYLDRSLLNNTHAATDRLPQLVRYVGMVQDMMDAEYYNCKDSKGRSTHFRDAVFVDDGDADAEEKQHNNDLQGYHDDLAERTPLVVVPLPFASDWLQKGLRPESASNNSAKASSPKSVAHAFDARKRTRDDVEEEQDTLESSDNQNKRERGEDDEAMDGTGGDAAMAAGGTNTTTTNQPNDWWPAGTCGSSESECAVLAKFCYDQLHPENASPNQRRLMLNDMVSMVGVLSINPWEADFSKQQKQGPGEECMEGAGWGDDFAPSLPPPSLLPRLHVLSYERLDLEEMAQRAVHKTKAEQEKEETVEEIKDSNVKTDTPASCPKALLSLFDTQSNPKETKQLAEALWMCLLSKADRRSNGKADDEYLEILRAGPMERALGCLSLQLSMPDMDRSRALFQHLANNVLPTICPVVATVDFTKKQDIVQLGVGPGKDTNGRLQPCPLQLPAGSVLLVQYDPKSNGMATASKAVQGAMLELVQHHRLPYRFEGDVVLPFEADYRVIVVTTQTNQLPCTLTVMSKDRIAASTTEVEEATYDNLREMLCSARSDNTSNGTKLDVKLSASLMERAQQDFMSRRRAAHEIKQQQQASGRPFSSTLPGEDDFHRWLTMTKIQAKSRYSTETSDAMEATVEDWEMALKVDDASQKAMAVA